MRLPFLPRRENSSAAQREREEQVAKAVTQGLRSLSEALKKLADLIDARRLERGGYHKQEQFLERTSKKR